MTYTDITFPVLNLTVFTAEFDALFDENTFAFMLLVLVYALEDEVEFL